MKVRVGIIIVLGMFAAGAIGTLAAGGSSAGAITSDLGRPTHIRVVTDTQGQTITKSRIWVPLRDATTFVTIPTETRALVMARFTGEVMCVNGPGSVAARIMIGGIEAEPASGTDFIVAVSDSEPRAHAFDRSRGPLTAGTYRVQVEWYVTDNYPTCTVDDWSLTVETAEVR